MKSINDKILEITALALYINQNSKIHVGIDLTHYSLFLYVGTIDADGKHQGIEAAKAWLANQDSARQVAETQEELDHITQKLTQLKQRLQSAMAVTL
ncbi:hypothetical protein VQ643_09605 [Pseudomonas sp. F1_0610]|uniref:hypothetical protein n=1 Tax=Pseudomonas sp. F1_0610 TaxID=3114284 RepID=UPI0039C2DE24